MDGFVRRFTPLTRTALATSAALAVMTLVMMGELARLVGDSLTPTGEVASLGAVVSLKALGSRHAWDVWQHVLLRDRTAFWIGSHALVDLAFVAGYARVLLWLVRASAVGQRLVALLVLLQVLESALLLSSAAVLASGSVWSWLTLVLAIVSTVKWLALISVLVTVVREDGTREALLASSRRTLLALKYQRLSVLPALLLGLLSTIPGANIFDQLPDVERGWVDDAGGALHLLVALLSLLVVALLLHHLGRRRYARAVVTQTYGTPPADSAGRGIWLIGPSAVLALAVLLAVLDIPDSPEWKLVLIFVLAPVVLVAGSLAVVRFWPSQLWSEQPSIPDDLFPRAVARVGDGLAMSLVWVLGVGMVRSFTAPVFSGSDAPRAGWELVLLCVGVLVSVLAFPIGVRVLRRVHPVVAPTTSGNRTRGSGRLLVAIGSTGLLVNLLLVLFPFDLAEAAGVVATVTLGVGGWVALLGSLIVYLQDRQPLEVFRALHLKANPLLSMFFVVPLVLTVTPGSPSLHSVRTLPGTDSSARLHLRSAFEDWLQKTPCTVRAGDVNVRPMLLVAASGGGIRASYWTASFEQRLADAGGCAPSVTLLSSGVSGGSVGLAVSRLRPQDPLAAVRAMAAPDALSVGLEGTLVGDLVGGSSGLRLPPSLHGPWTDRAGLMERAWEHAVPQLRQEWDAAISGPAGALVLNSTSVGYGCRVLVSQVDLSLGTPDTGEPNCRVLSGEPAAALDLRTVYGDCMPSIRWTTAAMLSARFPTVTPAGRIPLDGTCAATRPDLLLVDGGYAEASGVGTLSDIAGQVVSLVRDHNARSDGSAARPYVLPFVAYLEDEVRSDVLLAAPAKPAEAFVPLVGSKAKKTQVTTNAYLQRVSQTFADPCPGASQCDAANAQFRTAIPDGVLFVGPSTLPGVNAPLGWTLSGDSQARLDGAMQEQATRCAPETTGYVGLAALLALTSGHLGCSS
ncbi:MAG: hypothetical protein JWO22_897 [Frankiales bacterium]|nr:hypothetical protein [Frankiales bacterium]